MLTKRHDFSSDDGSYIWNRVEIGLISESRVNCI